MTPGGNAHARAARALDRILNRPKQATLGWQKSDTEIVITAPGGLGRVYITWPESGTRDTAVNRRGVPLAGRLPILVVPGAPNVIVDIDSSDMAAVTAVFNGDYGTPPHAASHQHGGSDEVATATPAANAIPKADASGLLDAWVTPGGTQEQVEDWVAAQLTPNTGRVQFTYDDGTGALTAILDVSAADKILYSTGADAWAEADLSTFMRGLLGSAAASNARTTLGITVYDQETAEDIVGAMVSGNTETGVAVTYNDGTGKIDFDAQTAGDARYGRLAAANGWAATNIFGSNTGILQSSPQVPLHVGAGTDVPAASLADIMAYFTRNGNTSIVIRNATNDVELIVAAGGSAGVFGAVTNHDLRLRANNVDHVLISAGGNVGIGTTAPQGPLHVHDGVGGHMFVTKTGINGTAQTLIPNAAGDITRYCRISGVADDGTVVYSISQSVAVSSSFTISDGGVANQITFAVSSGGALTVQRTVGSRTWQIAVTLTWI